MTDQGHKVISLHGAFDAAQRDNVMDLFRSGKAKVLITTNVLARGIDILMVSEERSFNESQFEPTVLIVSYYR
jgi:ATP-dependent RNA helicase DDX19/DBP5